jgi:hypothetical protein
VAGLCGSFVPWLFLRSSHVVVLRYFLPALPLLLATPVLGILFLTRPLATARPLAAHGARLILLLVLGFASVKGAIAYNQDKVDIEPVKPDWRAVVHDYLPLANERSCLVVVDDVATAAYNVVPYYLARARSTACYVDGRSPLLAEVLASHHDVWLAVGTQWSGADATAQLVGDLSEDPRVDLRPYGRILLIHPRSDQSATDPLVGLEPLLLRVAEIVEPEGQQSRALAAPAVRETLANVSVLTGRGADEAAALLRGYSPPLGDQDELQWDRALARLDRGDVAGARALAIRLVALYPGNADAYDLIAQVEQRVDNDRASRYRSLATALRA